MAEALKDSYGPIVPATIAAMIADVHPAFPRKAFLAEAGKGYEALNLMHRGRHIAIALRNHLPPDYPRALAILLASLDHEPPRWRERQAMASFLYLPHTNFVASFGLDHFEPSMHAQHVLTQRFTAEFSIRPFLEKHRDATLSRLRAWTQDENEHVRRLVSEGTRPRLPWASRLRDFQRDPRPVLDLLERLRDDPALYVRRSVANNLNDIGKDHPDLLVATATRWLVDASAERRWIVGHALRSAVKRAEPGALSALGYGGKVALDIGGVRITPKRAVIGGKLLVRFTLANPGKRVQRALVDLRVHYVKAHGGANAKVFKLTTVDLAPGASSEIGKTISLAQMSTRRHYPGKHRVEVMINGAVSPLGDFELREA